MAYRQERFPGARRVLAQDAVPRFDLKRTLMARMLASNPALSVLLLFGDVEMEQLDLDPRAGADPAPASFSRAEPDVHGLIIAGNLLVNGAVHHVGSPSGLSLYVLGGLRAATVAISGLELVVRDSVTVQQVFCGSGSQGGARLDGGVSAKLLISDGFPMLIGGRLAAPVLQTGRTRIGVVEGDGVREALGDVPPRLVLDERLCDSGPIGDEFSFPRLREALTAGLPLLTADFLSGRTNLESVRELRRLEGEIEQALGDGRFARSIDLLRRARELGAPRTSTGLQLAEAIYQVHGAGGDPELLAEALELLDEALGEDPDPATAAANPRALVRRAMILLRLHEFDDAALDRAWRDCSLAAVAMPADERAEVAGLIGQWLFIRHRYAECVPYLAEALAADPEDGVMHGRLARALWMQDREAEALPHADRSLELNPTDDRMWFVRGKCHQLTGNAAQARMDLQTYLELYPDDELAVEALVELGLEAGQVDLAVERAWRYVGGHPGSEGAPARFGRLFHQRGLHEAAVPLLRRAMEAEPARGAHVVDLALALTGLGRERPGLETALRSTEIDPDGDHLAYLRAECYLALGDLDRAQSDLETYTARFPDAARALASLAGIRLAQNRRAPARVLLVNAARLAPEDEYVREVAERAGLEMSDRVRPSRRASHLSR